MKMRARSRCCGIGTGEKVLHVQLARFGMPSQIGQKHIELRRGHRLIVVPPHRLFGHRIANNELVLDGATGVDARIDDQGAARGETALASANRQLDQLGFGKVALQGPGKD